MFKLNFLIVYNIAFYLAMLLRNDPGLNSSTFMRSSDEESFQVLSFWWKLWIK